MARAFLSPIKKTRGGGGGEHLGFQVTGIIEEFFGVEIFDSGIVLGGSKIWQVFFEWLDLSRVFLGITDLRRVVLQLKHNQRKYSWVSLVLLK